MNHHLEAWLSTVASQLDLPAKQKTVVLEELHAHVQADLADRLREGLREEAAVSATLAEMGDPEEAANGLNRVHAPEGSAVRTILALLLTFVGYFGIMLAEMGGLAQIVYRFGDVTGRWDWYEYPEVASHWVTADQTGRAVLILLPMSGLAFVVGFVARRRAWACLLAPVALIALVFVARLLAAPVAARAGMAVTGLATLLAAVVLPLAGANLGARLARSTSRFRLPLFGIGAGLAAVIPVSGWLGATVAPHSATTCVAVVGILALAFITNLGAWALVAAARRTPRAPT